MSNFFKNDIISLDFRVVRAFLTPEHVKSRYGILANFSAKTVLTVADKEVELMSHNALMLTVRNNQLAIGSHNKQDTWKDSQGNNVIGRKVYYTSLFPGDNLSKRNIDFVKELAIEIKQFAEEAAKNSDIDKNQLYVDSTFKEQLELF
jgi:hypothetical protein